MWKSGSSSLQSTPVRESVAKVIPELKHVKINTVTLKRVAERLSREEFRLPEWRATVFPDETTAGVTAEDVVEFLFVGNTINFQFRHYGSGAKFTAEYGGTEWTGAFGMWACLKRRFDQDKNILHGNVLADLSSDDVRGLFDPAVGMHIPMIDERHKILTSVGRTLKKEYAGQFRNLLATADNRLYAGGDGIVDKLVSEFESFRDADTIQCSDGTTQEVVFWKRAQLAAGMAYGRFQDCDVFEIADPGRFTVFPDYNLPNILRGLDIFSYTAQLADEIGERQTLDAGGRKEVELRAATIAATDALLELINTKRDIPIAAPRLDYKLFSMRDQVSTPIHLTRTTAY